MLQPAKVKWRKLQKGRRPGLAWRGSSLAFGDYGLQSLDRGWLTAREIEAARVALTYRTPVYLLSDAYLANGAEPWQIPCRLDGGVEAVARRRGGEHRHR